MYVVKTTSTGYSGLQLLPSYIHDPCLTQVQETDTVEVELVRVEVVLVQVQCHGHCSLVSVMITLVTGDDGLLLQLPVHQDSVTIKWPHIIINSPTQVKFTSLASKLIKPVILQ